MKLRTLLFLLACGLLLPASMCQDPGDDDDDDADDDDFSDDDDVADDDDDIAPPTPFVVSGEVSSPSTGTPAPS